MTTQTTDTPFAASIVVEAPIERAFSRLHRAASVAGGRPSTTSFEAELAEMVFEPREGGHVYDRGVDGSECRWARVLAYEPPHRVVFSWDISLQWQLETDPDEDQRSRGALHRRRPRPHPGRARASPPRAPRGGLGADARRGRIARRLGERPRRFAEAGGNA